MAAAEVEVGAAASAAVEAVAEVVDKERLPELAPKQESNPVAVVVVRPTEVVVAVASRLGIEAR